MKIPFVSHAVQKKFKQHDELKDTLLDLINDAHVDYDEDKRPNDLLISRLDWARGDDFETRDWIVPLEEPLIQHFVDCAKELGYLDVVVEQLWFQQYQANDTHQWHIHGDNYTGVYYLELPAGSPKTQIIDHSKSMYTVDAQEGDVIIFPSFLVHCSPPVEQTLRKTIISFNFRFEGVVQDV